MTKQLLEQFPRHFVYNNVEEAVQRLESGELMIADIAKGHSYLIGLEKDYKDFIEEHYEVIPFQTFEITQATEPENLGLIFVRDRAQLIFK